MKTIWIWAVQYTVVVYGVILSICNCKRKQIKFCRGNIETWAMGVSLLDSLQLAAVSLSFHLPFVSEPYKSCALSNELTTGRTFLPHRGGFWEETRFLRPPKQQMYLPEWSERVYGVIQHFHKHECNLMNVSFSFGLSVQRLCILWAGGVVRLQVSFARIFISSVSSWFTKA